ncbi:MAG: hypothetical protein ACYCYP_00670 [Leptospirales bacterium]
MKPKNTCPGLMEKAHNEGIGLAKTGKPYARLVPLEKEKSRVVQGQDMDFWNL